MAKKVKNGGSKKPHKRSAKTKSRIPKRGVNKRVVKRIGVGPKRRKRANSHSGKSPRVKKSREVRGLWGGRVGPPDGFDKQIDHPHGGGDSGLEPASWLPRFTVPGGSSEDLLHDGGDGRDPYDMGRRSDGTAVEMDNDKTGPIDF